MALASKNAKIQSSILAHEQELAGDIHISVTFTEMIAAKPLLHQNQQFCVAIINPL